MANIAMQDLPISGAAITMSAAAGGGDSFDFDPNGFLEFNNAGGGSITATVVRPGNDAAAQAVPDVAVVVPAASGGLSGNRKCKMHPSMINPATGKIDVTYSGVTSFTVAALRAPAA